MTRLSPGDPAPAFNLPDQDNTPVALSDYSGQQLIIFFYPAAMTPGCTTEAQDFRDAVEALREAGYAVVGISPDSPDKQAQFAEKEQLTYPLLSDADKSVMDSYGAYGPKTTYGKQTVGVIRSTVVIGPDGHVTLAKYNVRAKGHVASLAKALGVELTATS